MLLYYFIYNSAFSVARLQIARSWPRSGCPLRCCANNQSNHNQIQSNGQHYKCAGISYYYCWYCCCYYWFGLRFILQLLFLFIFFSLLNSYLLMSAVFFFSIFFYFSLLLLLIYILLLVDSVLESTMLLCRKCSAFSRISFYQALQLLWFEMRFFPFSPTNSRIGWHSCISFLFFSFLFHLVQRYKIALKAIFLFQSSICWLHLWLKAKVVSGRVY